MKIMQKIKVHGRACQHCDMLYTIYNILYHSAGKHDRGPSFLHYFHLDSSEVVQLVQFKFKIF